MLFTCKRFLYRYEAVKYIKYCAKLCQKVGNKNRSSRWQFYCIWSSALQCVIIEAQTFNCLQYFCAINLQCALNVSFDSRVSNDWSAHECSSFKCFCFCFWNFLIFLVFSFSFNPYPTSTYTLASHKLIALSVVIKTVDRLEWRRKKLLCAYFHFRELFSRDRTKDQN